MFNGIPEDQNSEHEWDGGDEEPFDAWIARKSVDVHAEEAYREREWEEYEGDPGKSPHACAELERVACVANAN